MFEQNTIIDEEHANDDQNSENELNDFKALVDTYFTNNDIKNENENPIKYNEFKNKDEKFKKINEKNDNISKTNKFCFEDNNNDEKNKIKELELENKEKFNQNSIYFNKKAVFEYLKGIRKESKLINKEKLEKKYKSIKNVPKTPIKSIEIKVTDEHNKEKIDNNKISNLDIKTNNIDKHFDFLTPLLDKELNILTKKERQIKLREILLKQIEYKLLKNKEEKSEEKNFRNAIILLNEEIYQLRESRSRKRSQEKINKLKSYWDIQVKSNKLKDKNTLADNISNTAETQHEITKLFPLTL